MSCNQNLEQTTTAYLAGHTFSTSFGGVLDFTFHKNTTVVYRWRNTWEKEIHSRNDLYYSNDDDLHFTIYTKNDSNLWSRGEYFPSIKPYVLIDNFAGDTLYLQ